MLPTIFSPSPTEIGAALAKWSSFLGIYLLNFFSVISLIWGNLCVYTSSYFYFRVKEPGAIQTPWPVSFFFVCWALGMLISKSLFDRVGKRLVCCVGILLVNGGYFLSYFTVQYSVIALTVTVGVSVGLGCGIIMSITLVLAVEWTYKYVGFATTSVLASAGLGAVIINQMITLYVNPDNLRPDVYKGKVMYFSQPQILDKVPQLFISIGTISLSVNLLGLIFLGTKKIDTLTESTKLLDDFKSSFKSKKPEDASQSRRDDSSDSSNNCFTQKKSMDEDSRSPIDQLKEKDIKDVQRPSFRSSDKQGTCGKKFSVAEFTTFEVLKTFTFYAFSMIIMFSDLTYLTLSTSYKEFGLIYIYDDHFMTNIGTCQAAIIALFILLSGIISDRIGLKSALVGSMSLLTILSAFYYFVPMISKWFFGITTVLYTSTIFFNYSLFIVGTLKLFGQKHYSTNYGLASVGGIMINVMAPPFIEYIVESLGWFYLFFSIGLVNCISLVLAIVGLPSV